MPYYQEGCNVDSFAYVSVLKPNLPSAIMREKLLPQHMHLMVLELIFSWNGCSSE
jgi:hypothetical protein